MTTQKLVSKYIASADQVLEKIQFVETPLNVNVEDIKKTVTHAKTYLDDAKYYRGIQKFDVSLTSVAYCEGLLDALRFIGAVKFEWPTKPQENREK